jgi:hypothetical protein
MALVFESLSGVFSCMLMISLGYFLTMRKWFSKETGQLFSKFAMMVTIPLYMVVSMMKSYTKQDLMQLGIAVALPALTITVTYLIGVAVSYVIRVPAHRHGTFRAMFFSANSAFIGFPVNVALFGEKALPIAVMYYLVQSMLFWTVAAYGLSIDGPKFARLEGGADADVSVPPVLSLKTIKNVLSPPLIGAIVAIIFILGDVRLPTFLNGTFNYLGSMTTPLAMLFIGIAIYVANLRQVRITFDMAVLIAARFLVAPAVVLIACHFLPVSDLMRKVVIVEAAMPVMTQVSIAARAYKADANYVAVVTAVTTVLSMITIPTYFLLLNFGWL